MSARPLDLAWDAQSELWAFPVNVRHSGWAPRVRQVGTSAQELRCPECASIVYSRRHKHCSVCSQPLPEHLLFTEDEAQRVEHVLESERARHRRWMRR